MMRRFLVERRRYCEWTLEKDGQKKSGRFRDIHTKEEKGAIENRRNGVLAYRRDEGKVLVV